MLEDLKGDNDMENTKDSLEVNTSEGLLTTEPYDDGFAKGLKIAVNGNIAAHVDVTDDGEIRILGYKEYCDEPSMYYSVNR